MKHWFFVLFAIIISGIVSVSAQEKNYEIEISMPETIVSRSWDEIPLAVKIKNYSQENLRTDSLGDIYFYFSKCDLGILCDKTGDKFVASARIPSKVIRENGVFEFDIDLVALIWKDDMDETMSSGNTANFDTIPAQNSNFYAAVRALEGYRPIANATGKAGARRPVFNYKFSNGISVTIE